QRLDAGVARQPERDRPAASEPGIPAPLPVRGRVRKADSRAGHAHVAGSRQAFEETLLTLRRPAVVPGRTGRGLLGRRLVSRGLVKSHDSLPPDDENKTRIRSSRHEEACRKTFFWPRSGERS